jgi:hypothetical protein
VSEMNRTAFRKQMEARRNAGLCNCWDHLRADGITPPRSERSRHPRYPYTVFSQEYRGEPEPERKKDDNKKGDYRGKEERSHLREAVANRSVM